mmetsp:Transcript_27103/g.53221  ORF Transcript_27103/g.53221 Transcript_27103/m.53221 type:complete len:82 (-) Transcript_27103:3707-3952(-)
MTGRLEACMGGMPKVVREETFPWVGADDGTRPVDELDDDTAETEWEAGRARLCDEALTPACPPPTAEAAVAGGWDALTISA